MPDPPGRQPGSHQPQDAGPSQAIPPGSSSRPAGDAAAGDDDEFSDCLTDAQIAGLTRADWEEPDPGDPQFWDDPGCLAPPDWLEVSAEEQARLLAEADPEAEPRSAGVAEAIDAGFTHRDGGSGAGFEAGGALDVLLPGSQLARHAAWARRDLAALSDDALVGVMDGGRRLEAWAAQLKHASVAELDNRRAGSDGAEGEHVAAEVSAALRQTRRSAQITLERARGLERLAPVAGLLAAGVIDVPRADVLVRRLELLPDEHAAKVLDRVLARAGEMTTGELGAAVDRAVIAVDPAAAQRRREKAQKDARVESWTEDSGTAALAGRDLSPAEVIAALKNLDADARWLKDHGVDGSRDQLCAKAYIARLNRIPVESLVPASPGTPGTAGTGSARETGTDGQASAGRPGSAGGHPGTDCQPDAGRQTSRGSQASAGSQPAMAGSVNLTMPASAFLRLTDNPGEVASYGPADAATCRDLASRLGAAGPATTWCVTVVDGNGQAVAHGCARASPPGNRTRASRPPDTGPPVTSTDFLTWLAGIKIIPIARISCGHQREAAGYRPPESLRHLIKIRSPRCGEPGCRAPAHQADDDHTIPYHLGGKTCECNLHPLCRRSHRTKQAPGWHVTQPQPGTLIWQLPSGRSYTKTAEPYPI